MSAQRNTYQRTRETQSASRTVGTRTARTSSFDRFATPTTDYWTGSTAPDFAYWDALSASELDAWVEEVPAKKTATQEVAQPARKKSSRTAGSKIAAPRTAAKTQASQAAVVQPVQPASFAFIVLAVLIVAATVLSFIRIDFSSDTVLIEVANQEISSTIASTRSAGKVLEVNKTVLSKATRIEYEAVFLGMMEPEAREALILNPDTVATDGEGNLSLSLSVSRVAQSA